MLILKEPLQLKALTKFKILDDGFSQKLMADYTIMNTGITSQELLYLAMAPMELFIQEGSLTSLVLDNSSQINQEVKLQITNHMINRILWALNSGYTYQDCVAISLFLRKLGIGDTREFIRQIQRMVGMESHIKELIRLYQKQEGTPDRVLVQEKAHSLEIRPGTLTTQEIESQNRLYLHQNIYKRLDTQVIYNEISRFTKDEGLQAGQYSLMVSQQSRIADWMRLLELKQKTWGQNTAPIHHFHNIYELVLPREKTDVRNDISSQAAAAVLSHMIGMVFEANADTYLSRRPVWVNILQDAFLSAGDTLKRLDQNHIDMRYDYYLEVEYQNMTELVYQEELSLWNEYIKSQNNEEWMLFYSGISSRIETILNNRKQNHRLQSHDVRNTYETLYQSIASDIYHRQISLLEEYQSDYKYPDSEGVTAKKDDSVKDVFLSEYTESAKELEYQYYDSYEEYNELLNSISKEELDLVLKFPPVLLQQEDKEKAVKKYLKWLHKEYWIPKTEPAAEPEFLNMIYNQIQEFVKMEASVRQLYTGQEYDIRMKPEKFQPIVRYWKEQNLYNETFDYLKESFQTHYITDSLPKYHDSDGKKKETEISVLQESPDVIRNQYSQIDAGQLKQSLEQMNEEHRTIQNQLKQSFLSRSETAVQVIPDIARTRQQGLIALEHQDAISSGQNHLEAAWPVVQQRDREVHLLLEHMDEFTRGLYEKIMDYCENPLSDDSDGLIRKGTVGQLLAGINEAGRDYLYLEHERQELTEQEQVHKLWHSQELRESLEIRTENLAETESGKKQEPITFIHKQNRPEYAEEIISYLEKHQSEVRIDEISTKKLSVPDYHIEELRQEASEASKQGMKDIQEMIEQGINSHIGSISETVLQKLEKRLQSDRFRRGY